MKAKLSLMSLFVGINIFKGISPYFNLNVCKTMSRGRFLAIVWKSSVINSHNNSLTYYGILKSVKDFNLVSLKI